MSVSTPVPLVTVFTGTRADFGLLRPVLALLESDREVDVQLIVGGSHGHEQFGTTRSEIEASGLPIGEVLGPVPIGDDELAICQATALTLDASANALHRKKPDLAVVLGDRFEAMGFATACLLSRIPLAHIHGGETTHGAVDDSIRNAITQMADLHFVAAEQFGERVTRLGAAPGSVHVTGAPGLDAVAQTLDELADPKSVVESLTGALPDSRPVFLFAYHPASRSRFDQAAVASTLLDVLLDFPDSLVLSSAPNADWGRNDVADILEQRRVLEPDRLRFVASFGHRGFVHAMAYADVMVGNSSAGIIEAPLVGTASVTVGDRQSGRPLAASVFPSGISYDEIRAAIDCALAQPSTGRAADTLYGDGNAAQRIVHLMKEFLAKQ